LTETTAQAATESTFEGADGVEIFWRAWLPEGDPDAIVVISHGVSEHSGRYGHVAADLIGHGDAVYALDHRGHGRSEGDRAVIDSLQNAVADIDTLISIASGQHTGKPIFLLGHSLGGCLALAYALRHQDRLAGLILSAPVAVLEAASPVQLLAARLLSRVAPKLGAYSVDADAVSTDPAVVRDYETDPLNHHDKVPVRTLAEVAAEVETFPERLPSLRIPLLVMHGSEDTLVPLEASRTVEELAGSADKRLVIYPDMRHEILNEPEQDKVLTDIDNWLREEL